ncbi:MAG: hypothetical protein NTV63_03045 [Candidatus Woesearchaeota archaeon]|nr:hypothetical protein [Candidatus Woesearchaeota archaeon]
MIDVEKEKKSGAEKAGERVGFLFGIAVFALAGYFILSKIGLFQFRWAAYSLLMVFALLIYAAILVFRKK